MYMTTRGCPEAMVKLGANAPLLVFPTWGAQPLAAEANRDAGLAPAPLSRYIIYIIYIQFLYM